LLYFQISQKTKGGVLLPVTSQAKVLEGTVVAVGPGIKDRVGIYFFRQINTV
jgi:co-chaperonin GroES (HSP10)